MLAAGALAASGVLRADAQEEPTPAAPAASPTVVRTFGTSVRGMPLVVRERGASREDATRTVLVVGEVHGDEPGGPRVTRALRTPPLTPGTRLLLVDALNPDGLARRTRQNAHRVDLNRNARTGWKPGRRGERFWGGPRPFSEPESRAIRGLLQLEEPDVTVWFHQPYGLVDAPERGTGAVARRYARRVDLPFSPLAHFPGSLSRWTNQVLGPDRSFVVELGPTPPDQATVAVHVAALLALLRG